MLPFRTYRVIVGGHPVMRITEHFAPVFLARVHLGVDDHERVLRSAPLERDTDLARTAECAPSAPTT
jgi:hypothetical protein